MRELKGLTVYDWLGMSKEDFAKIRGKSKCVKCGKATNPYDNLCHGHHIAYHRWRNKKVREIMVRKAVIEKRRTSGMLYTTYRMNCPECGSPDTREQLDSTRKCAKCLHVFDPCRLVLSHKEGEKEF